MTSGMQTIIYPVKDLAAAKRLYSRLFQAEPNMDEEYYVGFKVGDQDAGLDPNGHAKGMTGPVGYWHVDDIEATLDSLVAAGATTRQEISNVGGGRLIAVLEDADGNPIGLLQDA